jgi:pimeloyl-ACP methyl ester carboxylesterase
MRWHVGVLVGLAAAITALAAVIATISVIQPKRASGQKSNTINRGKTQKHHQPSDKSQIQDENKIIENKIENKNDGVTQEEMAVAIRNTLLRPESLLKEEIEQKDSVINNNNNNSNNNNSGSENMGRWAEGLRLAKYCVHKMGQGLVDLKKREYRRLANLQEYSILITDENESHTVVYLDRPDTAGTFGITDRAKPVLLLLHGFCGDKDVWTLMAMSNRELMSSFRIIAPDIPGFGDSTFLSTSQYDVRSQARRIKDFLVALHIDKCHIVGSSMGGNIAARMAIEYPTMIRSLTLMNALGVGSPKLSVVGRQLLAGINPLMINTAQDFERFLGLVFAKPPNIPSFAFRYLGERIIQHRKQHHKILLDMSNHNDDLTPQLKSIKTTTTPTLIIWGDTDRVIDVSAAHRFHQLISHSKLHIFPSCGHAPLAELPSQTAKLILDFLTSIH